MARTVAHIAVVVGLFCQAAFAFADDEPVDVIGHLHQALVDAATAEPALDFAARYERLAPVIVETHDLATMGRVTVRRFWPKMTETERTRFSDAFERLSIASYASRFASVGPETFGIIGTEPIGSGRVRVNAVIHRRDADDVPMEYQLDAKTGRWRIVNVVADGVSELSLMASGYAATLEAEGFEGLLADIAAETATLEQ
jgi:phospholipid transport system substrate-binding protein